MNETTAQEASGATIAGWDDLAVDLFFTRRAPCVGQEAVDAAGPVDAQNAPTGPWKTADGFPQASTATIVSWIKKKEGSDQSRPATGQRQLPSSAAVASGAPLLTLRRQK